MAVVLVLCIFNGFRDLALSQLSNLDPDIAVVPVRGKTLSAADSIAATLAQLPGVATAMPVITERGLLEAGDTHLPVVMKGVPEGYDAAMPVDDIILAGEYAEFATDGTPAIQLSVGLANQISEYPSAESRLNLIVPRRKGRVNPANPGASFRGEEFAFSAVFRVNSTEVDNDHVIIPLEAARSLLDYDTEATAIEISVTPGFDAGAVRDEVSAMLGKSYKALDRLEQRADSFRMIAVEKWVTFMMLVFILVVAMFNVVSTLSLLAIEKRDNMTTLKALGAPRSMVRNIFIAEGFLVTVLGGAIGIVLGVAGAFIQQTFHVIRLAADEATLTINYYPVHLEWLDIAAVASVILVLATVVSGIARLIVRKA